MSKDKGNEAIRDHNVEVVGATPMVIRDEAREFGLELETLSPDEVVERIKKWNAVLDAVTDYAIQKTAPKDWCAIGSKGNTTPWLTGPGAERMARRCGLRVEYCDPAYAIETGKDDDGDFVKYTCRLRVSLGRWASIVAEGHCTSRDSFFSHGGRLSASRVDKGNLQQSAYTNALVNGVCRLLGIRRLTWPELKNLTSGNVTEDRAGSVAEFKSGGDGGATRGRADSPATPEQRTAIWREWCDVNGVDVVHASDDAKRDAAKRFYDWVVMVLGDAGKRDRDTWVEADIKRMREKVKLIREQGDIDAPDAPPLDEMP